MFQGFTTTSKPTHTHTLPTISTTAKRRTLMGFNKIKTYLKPTYFHKKIHLETGAKKQKLHIVGYILILMSTDEKSCWKLDLFYHEHEHHIRCNNIGTALEDRDEMSESFLSPKFFTHYFEISKPSVVLPSQTLSRKCSIGHWLVKIKVWMWHC